MRLPTLSLRRLALFVTAIAVVLGIAIGSVGEAYSHPAKQPIGAAPAELAAQTVRIATAEGTLVGWLTPGQAGQGAVLLLHGVKSNRQQMLPRIRLLQRLGYAVLAIDLPAHGESAGDRITFGWRESHGVRAALAYLRQRLPGEKIGVIGISLGAASFMLAKAAPQPDAVVLESMFPTIREAIEDRMERYLGSIGRSLSPLLVYQLPLRLNVTAEQLRPIDHMHELHAPLLIAAGAADQNTTLAETRRIFAQANQPKSLWVVPHAGHVDLQHFAPAEYEQRIGDFLARNLRQGHSD